MSWMTDLSTRMSSGELAKSVKDAEALLELHKERKVGNEWSKNRHFFETFFFF